MRWAASTRRRPWFWAAAMRSGRRIGRTRIDSPVTRTCWPIASRAARPRRDRVGKTPDYGGRNRRCATKPQAKRSPLIARDGCLPVAEYPVARAARRRLVVFAASHRRKAVGSRLGFTNRHGRRQRGLQCLGAAFMRRPRCPSAALPAWKEGSGSKRNSGNHCQPSIDGRSPPGRAIGYV